MKLLNITILLFAFTLSAQNDSIPLLKFETEFYKGTDRWVAFPKSTKNELYPFGIIYIDQTAGFTFEYVGNFKIENQRLINLDTSTVRTSSMKHRLQSNTRNLHVFTDNEIEELGLEPTSKWIETYKWNAETPKYKVDIASFYNAVGGSKIALPILEGLYSNGSKDKKLLFELSYAYNALKDYSNARDILLKSIKEYPDDELFYKELSYAYIYLEELSKSEKTYTDYIKNTKERRYQAEMAYNLTYSFFANKNIEKFNEWASITSKIPKANQVFSKNIELMKKELEKL
ncbi:MAG: hypothetical protein EVB11_05895 [Winogradskyella sp.]|nr:MAG: hypothetical protein EVB11_05895 [Winogradskyella sp.]